MIQDIASLQAQREEWEGKVQDFKAEYQRMKAKQEHDRKRFEKEEQDAIMQV